MTGSKRLALLLGLFGLMASVSHIGGEVFTAIVEMEKLLKAAPRPKREPKPKAEAEVTSTAEAKPAKAKAKKPAKAATKKSAKPATKSKKK